MRLHDLTVTAFGPFAGTEHVDFDELNDAGLFLMTGPTGAGKSSLLDAVCFALYGTVPGARGVKTLKSQHACADARPEVVLDLSVRGRRFVLRRTPEWTRPKRRGTGVVVEKASASVTETTGGTDHFLSSRAAEVGLLVRELMGMNADQFVQVALLPQGEFQRFLRASSQERHDVLQQLFRTDRFARIEDWVSDRSRRLTDQSGVGRSSVQRILDTVADRAELDLPDELGADRLAGATAEGRVGQWVDGVLATLTQEAGLARETHGRAEDRYRLARRRHQAAVQASEQRTRMTAARLTLEALGCSEPTADLARAALEAHDRASRCGPVLELHARAVAARRQAAEEHRRALGPLTSASAPPATTLPAELTGAAVSVLVDAVRAHAARCQALVPREQAAAEIRTRRDADLHRLAAADLDLATADRWAERLPAELETCTAALSRAIDRAARCDPLTSAVAEARARLVAAVQLTDVRRRLDALQQDRRDARDLVLDARQELQLLVARRLAGMAAELAGALADGVACQVCGSTEHPDRASAAPDAVTDRDHELADQRLAGASSALDAADQALRNLQPEHDQLVATCAGLDPEQADEQATRLDAELAAAAAASRERGRLEHELQVLKDEQEAVSRERSTAAAAAAALGEAVAAHERTLSAVSAEVAEALGDERPASTLAEFVAVLSTWGGLLAHAGAAITALDAADARLAESTALASTAATEHGFADADEVDRALLPDDVAELLEAQLSERADVDSRARAVLDDPTLAEMSDDPLTELSASADELVGAESASEEALRVLTRQDDRATSLTRLAGRLTTEVDAWAPVRDQALRTEAISRLVRGLGQDNQLQMRLSAYVLATRLDQVLAAANERLGHLRDQRYLLQRTGRAERRSSQAGLGLEVVDQWTGDVRLPSTLSGGETFVVSLSLALGLADVVTQEAGGTEIETLFVDEGFGTLDADTLDDVMDRLDGLRAGGRTVGVVSHVTELRSRIPTQVHVAKGRTGSTVAVRTLVG